MPIIPTSSSTERKREFERGLAHLVRLGRVPAGLDVEAQAQPIYLLSTQDAAKQPDLNQVGKLVAWRYFATNAKGDVVAGEVSASLPPTLSNLRYGAPAKKILEATKALDELPQVQAGSFYLRVLRVPGALTEGFWLPSATGTDGVIVPFGRSFDAKRPDGRPIGIDGFLGTLRPVGERRPSNR
jgi:hypothetical protein